MTGSEEPGRRGGLMGWAQDARVRSATCAAQAVLAAESAAAIGEQVDRMIERAAERNPEYAERLQAIVATAAGQRAAIAEWKRSCAAGRPDQLRDMVVVQDRDRAAAELQDQVIQRVFTAGLTLQDAAELTAEPEVHWRIEAAADYLDELIRVLRGALFKPGDRPPVSGP